MGEALGSNLNTARGEINLRPSMVTWVCNPYTQEAKAGGSQAGGQIKDCDRLAKKKKKARFYLKKKKL